tara:strand:+ start:130 stop:297 length:168 start_codon:yes stop_codon:yes gene_type:complete
MGERPSGACELVTYLISYAICALSLAYAELSCRGKVRISTLLLQLVLYVRVTRIL